MWSYKNRESETIEELLNLLTIEDGKTFSQIHEEEERRTLEDYETEITERTIERMVEKGIVEEVD